MYSDLKPINCIESTFNNHMSLEINPEWIPEFWCKESQYYFSNHKEGIRWRKVHDKENTFESLHPPQYTWNEIKTTFYISGYDKKYPNSFEIDSHLKDLKVPAIGSNGFFLNGDCVHELLITDDVVRLTP